MISVAFFGLMVGIGILAGIISAAAGLASLITYPSLLAMGLPPVTANVTSAFSTIASGYSSLFASTEELKGHSKQVKIVLPLVLVGSVLGAWLLFALPGTWFKYLVPVCIGIGGVILIFPHQPKQAHATMAGNVKLAGKSRLQRTFNLVWIFLIGVYAGYFNAGAGVLCLTLLTIINRQDSFAVNNALKNVAMTATNTTAWIVFAMETTIHWNYVLPLLIGNIIGGILGPMIVRRLPGRLMQIIVGLGALGLAISLTIRNFS